MFTQNQTQILFWNPRKSDHSQCLFTLCNEMEKSNWKYWNTLGKAVKPSKASCKASRWKSFEQAFNHGNPASSQAEPQRFTCAHYLEFTMDWKCIATHWKHWCWDGFVGKLHVYIKPSVGPSGHSIPPFCLAIWREFCFPLLRPPNFFLLA